MIASPQRTNAPDGIAPSPTASFQVIDVNLACPVKKIDRKNRGGHWLAHPGGAIDILRAVRAAVPAHIPCTVKLRRAYDDTPEMARNFEIIFDAAFELDYAWATVHARTVEQKYIGPSRWTFLRDLTARRPDCTVLGSGDVWDVHDIFRMIAYTAAPPTTTHTPPARSVSARTGDEVPGGDGAWPDPDAQTAPGLDEILEGVRARRGVAGVAVARGCIGNPWVFRQAREMMAGREPTPPTLAQQRRVLWEHFALSAAVNGERAAGKLMRKFGIRFSAHHPTPEPVRQRMIAVNSTADWLGAITEFYPEHADDAG